MATFYIQRKDTPYLTVGTLTTKAAAFRTLYCGPFTTDPKLKIYIRGEWPEQFKGAGLWARNSALEVVSIGKKFIWVTWSDDGQARKAKVDLCPTNDTGFTEIMFMTDR